MKDKAYEIAINPKYDGYQRGFSSMLYKFFDNKTGLEAKANVSEEPAQELNKPVIKTFKRRRVYVIFKDNIWAAELAEMGSLPSENRGVKNLLYVIDIFLREG